LQLTQAQAKVKEMAQKHLEEKNKALEEKNEAIERLDREKSLAYRKQVICRTCDQIFLDPVLLPCSNTICKSRINDFKQDKCQFCLQSHSTLLNEVKLNENLNEMLKMCLHLDENEKKLKSQIEKLLETNKNLTEDLKQKEAESEILCFDHFAKIKNDIDLQREELKKRIDELSFELIDKVKEIKFNYETNLKTISSQKVFNMNEIDKIENDFVQELRKKEFPQENLSNIENSLKANAASLNNKREQLKISCGKIKACTFVLKVIDMNSKIFGEINFQIVFY